jgi:hypothetical protein
MDRTDISSQKVNFLIAGTQKGGTTALHGYLRQHGEICMPKNKEIHFFDNEEIFLGKPDYGIYNALFEPEDNQRAIGEATPIYMYWHDAPRRIWEYNQNMKFIIILRNPITRAFSHWRMETRRQSDNVSFLFALQNETKRCRVALPFQHRVYSYQDRGFYCEQLRHLWRFFPKDQVLILKSEAFRCETQKTLNEIFQFLGVTPLAAVLPEGHTTPIPGHHGIGGAEYELLRAVFFDEIKGLERLLGWDCSDWLA